MKIEVTCAEFMTLEFQLKRYAAYYRGWCQTFGEHESVLSEDDSGISWLFNEQQVGFISPQELTKSLLREVLRRRETPSLTISHKKVQIGRFKYGLARSQDEPALIAIKNLLETGGDTHIFLTSHLMYGTGARIVTLSNKKPLLLIYKEIGSMRIRLK